HVAEAKVLAAGDHELRRLQHSRVERCAGVRHHRQRNPGEASERAAHLEPECLEHGPVESQDAGELLLLVLQEDLGHTGITPCRLAGFSTCLVRAIRRALTIVGRVSRGSMMSSITALPAAM